jgi:hypothetical protein
MSLETIIKDNLPALPELVKMLREKFSTSKTFKTDNGELICNGEIIIGADVFLMEADKQIPAPTKTYKHEDGTEVIVEAGKVVDIKKVTSKEPVDAKEFAEELFKAFPKTDLTGIEKNLTELKETLTAIKAEKADLAARVAKFEGFKDEVIGILDKFSKAPSVKPAAAKKTDSSKSFFNAELSLEDRIKILNETKI